MIAVWRNDRNIVHNKYEDIRRAVWCDGIHFCGVWVSCSGIDEDQVFWDVTSCRLVKC